MDRDIIFGIFNPPLVCHVQLVQVFRGNPLFELSAASADPGDKRIRRCLEIDNQIRLLKVLGHYAEQIAVILIISGGHIPHLMQVIGKDLHILVDGAILHGGEIALGHPLMGFESLGEKINLQIEAPAPHIGIEIVQIRIVDDALVKRLPAEPIGDNVSERGFPNADVAGDTNEICGLFGQLFQ